MADKHALHSLLAQDFHSKSDIVDGIHTSFDLRIMAPGLYYLPIVLSSIY